MTATITVTTPDGGRAVFTRRGTGTGAQYATDIPGTIELPALAGDDYYQVTLRTGTGTAWSEAFAIRPDPGEHQLEDLPRLPLGEAQAGGFALTARVAAVESQLGGEVFDRLNAHELALGVAEDIFEAHLLDLVTWLPSSGRVEIPGYVPQPVARSYRLELDIVTENHATTGDLWVRVMGGETILLHLNFGSQVNRAGDNHRYRFTVDFNAPADADLHLTFANSLRTPDSGRAGYTRPQLTSPTVRSA